VLRKLVVVLCLFAMSPSRAEAWNPIKAASDKLKAAGHAVGGHGKQASSAVLADIELNYRARRLRFL
jgi:hypothetical protein